MSDRAGIKRYNLAIPQELYEQVEMIAAQNHTTVVDVLRRFIKLGLIAAHVEQTPDARIIIKEGAKEREIIFL